MVTIVTTGLIITMVLTTRYDSHNNYNCYIQILSKISKFKSDYLNGHDYYVGLRNYNSYNNSTHYQYYISHNSYYNG